MKPRIFVTRRVPDAALIRLNEVFEVELYPHDQIISKADLLNGVRNKDALYSLFTDTVDSEVIDACPGLKVISNCGVGFNNIDVKVATAKGIPVCNTPGVLTETCADFTWALILALARRVCEADRFVRNGLFKGTGPMFFLGSDVYGKVLGIVGMGRIGSAVARRAHGFKMRILYFSQSRERDIESECGARLVSLDELLEKSDIVTLHTPYTVETRHLIGPKQFSKMKSSAYLVNTARGPIVDEKALVTALRSKQIAGAALDVYEEEPIVSAELLQMNNVVLAPHISSASIETRTRMAVLAAENAIAVITKQRPRAIVNPEVL